MDAPFWHERWQRGEIGFHKSRANPLLVRWWSQLQLPPGCVVCLPLCGKSLDLLWLREQGHVVLGIELSRSALNDFARENHLALNWRREEPFDLAEGQGMQLFAGDFFAVQPAHVEQVAGVYDRAALIALPPDMRTRYVAHMIDILPASWRMLLVTLDYPQAERPGPPFSVSDSEVRELFAGCEITLLDEQDVLDDHAMFRQQGMTQLCERVYLISKPAAV